MKEILTIDIERPEVGRDQIQTRCPHGEITHYVLSAWVFTDGFGQHVLTPFMRAEIAGKHRAYFGCRCVEGGS